MVALFVILPLIFLIGGGVWIFFSCRDMKEQKTEYYEEEEKVWGTNTPQMVKKKRTVEVFKKSKIAQLTASIIICIGAVLTLFFVPGSFHQVDAGEVAVVKVWGDAKYTRQAGLHFDLWISHKYDIYDAKVQQIVTTTETYSNDGQTMDIELVIQYKIQQDKAMNIANTYGGLQMLESRIENVAINEMKGVLAQKSAMKIIETRATVSEDVTKAVTTAIKDGYYADITTVVLTDISFTDAFEKTVEDKMIAEQEQLKAKYEKEKAIIQAEQALEVAKLEAEAALAKAKGDANAQKAIADAEAYSTQIKIVELARVMGYYITEKEIEGTQSIKNPAYVDEETTPDVDKFIDEPIIIGYKYTIDWNKDSKGNPITGDADGKDAILSYLKYLEYLAKWDGELPDVVTGEDISIFIPKP